MLARRVLPHAVVGALVQSRPVRVVLCRRQFSRTAALSGVPPFDAVNAAEDEAFLVANFSPWVTDQAGAKRCLAFLREKEQVWLDTLGEVVPPLCFPLFTAFLPQRVFSRQKATLVLDSLRCV